MVEINKTVLMSGSEYFAVEELNPYSHKDAQPDKAKAAEEFDAIRQALADAGITVETFGSPVGCQDGIYTANWGLCRNGTAILSSLPHMRSQEEVHAREALEDQGLSVIPAPFLFSGQGDALPCGDLIFMGQGYRTDPRMHQVVADELGYQVISLQTVPQLDRAGQPVINAVTQLPNSYFYDLDLALAVITPELIAWCPEAFTPESQTVLKELEIDKIEVGYSEAVKGFACNLVSTGETVVISNKAPELQSELEARGFTTVTPDITELAKGGGYIRCTTLTLDNA